MIEKAIVFACHEDDLVGIVHDPESRARRGVVIVVGGPQYRAGSHRQYVLLARSLAAAGLPVLRFDYRGLGDSDGDYLGFEHLHKDIAAAIDAFMAAIPGLEEVVLWGLCDGASASLFYGPHDARVTGLVLLNPWTRSETTLARTHLRHYYPRRVLERAFWRKLAAGGVNLVTVGRSLGTVVARAILRGQPEPDAAVPVVTTTLMPAASPDPRPLPERMMRALKAYDGRVLLIMSGNDLTALEFDLAMATFRRWRRLLARGTITRQDLKEADHTFSAQSWHTRMTTLTRAWITGS